jgi:hypothetical protein
MCCIRYDTADALSGMDRSHHIARTRLGCLPFMQDQAILDQIQRRVGEERLQQRIAEQKRKSWIKRS